MLMINEKLKKFESEHYRVTFQIFLESNSNKWMGVVRIKRKDTDEIVRGGFRVIAQEKDAVEEKLISKANASLKLDIEALGIPYEWNSPVRPILVRYLSLRRKNTGFWLRLDDVFDGKKDSKDFSERYTGFWNKIISESIALARSIEMLDKQERIGMLVSPDSVFDDPSDPWSLDDLDARIDIFKFFLNPSEAEINAHKTQLEKLSDTYHKLGWDKSDDLDQDNA